MIGIDFDFERCVNILGKYIRWLGDNIGKFWYAVLLGRYGSYLEFANNI